MSFLIADINGCVIIRPAALPIVSSSRYLPGAYRYRKRHFDEEIRCGEVIWD
jgi:hypothetical protein